VDRFPGWSRLRQPQEERQFRGGHLLMFSVGLIMTGTFALVPTMLQHLMDYPALTIGLVTAPRGFGVMIAMLFVARLITS
jgi:DHA2 family multidrug resistance protein